MKVLLFTLLLPILANAQVGWWFIDQGGVIPSTNTSPVVLTQTNFISGKLYTNLSGRPIYVQATAALTGALVNGSSEMDLKTGDGASMSVVSSAKKNTILTGLTISDQYQIGAYVSTNTVYTFTNTSSGAGNASSLVAGSGQVIQF